MSIRNILAMALLIYSTTAMPLSAQDSDIEVTIAPPPPQVEEIPSEAPPGQIWSKGYWMWKGNSYVWVAGHWIEGHADREWVSEHWVERDGRWHFVPGAWQDHR